MSLTLALLLFTGVGEEVVGLKPGETVTALDPAHALDVDSILRSRILRADTGEPLDDVLVEAWTENGEAPQSIEQCIDRAKSNAGGQVEIDCLRQSVRASKLRVSKPAFASATGTPSDMVDQELYLSP